MPGELVDSSTTTTAFRRWGAIATPVLMMTQPDDRNFHLELFCHLPSSFRELARCDPPMTFGGRTK